MVKTEVKAGVKAGLGWTRQAINDVRSGRLGGLDAGRTFHDQTLRVVKESA
jgi:hypothetical protein